MQTKKLLVVAIVGFGIGYALSQITPQKKRREPYHFKEKADPSLTRITYTPPPRTQPEPPISPPLTPDVTRTIPHGFPIVGPNARWWTYTEYMEQLGDERWKAKAREIKARDKGMCTMKGCYSRDELEVHHTCYERGVKMWEYPGKYLTTLCRKHHRETVSQWGC